MSEPLASIHGARPRWSRPITAAWLATVVFFLLTIAQYRQPGAGFTYLIGFGADAAEYSLPVLATVPHVAHRQGYDGQFYAQIALDPLLRDPAIDAALDAPPYRARRILMPWIAYAIGRGNPATVLNAYALLNVGAWVLLGRLLCRWCPPISLRHWAVWTACMTTHGLLISVRLALIDGPALLVTMVSLALLSSARPHPWLAGLAMGAAGLTRDTTLAGLSMAPSVAGSGRWRWLRMMLWVAIAVLPLLLWMDYLRSIYRAATLDVGTSNFMLPLGGLWLKVREATAFWPDVRTVVRVLVPVVALVTQAIGLASRPRWRDPIWQLGIGYVALMAVLGTPVWEGYPGAATRVLLPMTFAFNLLLLQRWSWTLFVLGNIACWPGIDVLIRPAWTG